MRGGAVVADELQHIDLDNPEFQDAWTIIRKTNRSVFLTGKAGTGKSTFLKYIRANTKKKLVVLAPTGIAAVNVGGQTMHSFFKIPFKPLLPDDPDISSTTRLRKTLRYTKEKVKLIRELELIIIDEISMVRADVIDFVDRVLRVYSGNMREPFGGKQLLLVGDIFQLEPVVTHDMRDILKRYYKNFFFFNARAFSQINLVAIELRKIYRQSDNGFISLLDRVRINRATNADIALLNQRCNPDYQEVNDNFAITLATRRDTVDAINDEHMQALKTPEYVYQGRIEGDFPENSLPTALRLTLKEGAQVIFIRNDKEGRWYNGTIGKVTLLRNDEVYVTLESGEELEVLPEVWENMQYTYNEKERKVEEKVLGTFMQVPIKPAWALTVHKSQGLTFNNVVIDFVGGAFTGGQTYVALSRCTSLEGISLKEPLRQSDIFVRAEVVRFANQYNDQQLINKALQEGKADREYRDAIRAFDKGDFGAFLDSFFKAIHSRYDIEKPHIKRYIRRKLEIINRQKRAIIEIQERDQKEIAKLREELYAKDEQLKRLAAEYTILGRECEREHMPEAAIRNYQKALELYPDAGDAKRRLKKLQK